MGNYTIPKNICPHLIQSQYMYKQLTKNKLELSLKMMNLPPTHTHIKQLLTHYLPLDGIHIPNLSSFGILRTKPNYFHKQ